MGKKDDDLEVIEPQEEIEETEDIEETQDKDQPEESEEEATEEPAESEKAEETKKTDKKADKKSKFKFALKWPPTKKQLLIAGGIVLFIILVWLIPATRNLTFGHIFKTNLTVEAYDETEGTDGQKARVQLNDLTVKIDGQVKADNATSPVFIGKVKGGKHKIVIEKSNYKTYDQSQTLKLSLGKQHNSLSTKLEATGIPTKIKVSHFVTGEVLKDIQVAVGESKALTDDKGIALAILPIQKDKNYTIELSGNGFNNRSQKINLDDKKSLEVTITPAGKVYFLSKASGKIDVVKSNLDGSDRKTVLAGTGKEEPSTITMISTTDWKYLALSTHRSDKTSQVIMIDTSDDSQTNVDEGNASFTFYGWDGHKLVYSSSNSDLKDWNAGHLKLKIYDGEHKSLSIPWKSAGTGSIYEDSKYESLGTVRLVNHRAIYQVYNYGGASTSPNYINSTAISDSATKKLYEITQSQGYINITYTSATEAYLEQWSYSAQKFSYFEVDENGNWKTASKPSETDQFTYFVSPDSNKLLWSEERDGKQTILLGDKDAKNEQKLYSLSELKPYAWFTNDYALYSKNNSELYIAAIKANSTPKKITDYHRPSNVQFIGYGGGGGGPY